MSRVGRPIQIHALVCYFRFLNISVFSIVFAHPWLSNFPRGFIVVFIVTSSLQLRYLPSDGAATGDNTQADSIKIMLIVSTVDSASQRPYVSAIATYALTTVHVFHAHIPDMPDMTYCARTTVSSAPSE